jgi:ISXO2-like transposase domain
VVRQRWAPLLPTLWLCRRVRLPLAADQALQGCGKQFSVTSGTIFHSRKLPIRDYLAAVAIFINGAKGHAALQLSRDLDCQYKTAFVLAHKLREAMGSEVHNPDEPELSGTVTIDGAYFGGKIKQANRKAERTDRRLAEEQTGKRQVVVVAREVRGRILPFIVPRESEAVPLIREHVASGSNHPCRRIERLGAPARVL